MPVVSFRSLCNILLLMLVGVYEDLNDERSVYLNVSEKLQVLLKKRKEKIQANFSMNLEQQPSRRNTDYLSKNWSELWHRNQVMLDLK